MNAAAPASDADVERGFTRDRAAVSRHLLHELPRRRQAAGQLDLRQYSTVGVRGSRFFPLEPRPGRLTAREMPPKQAKQPPDAGAAAGDRLDSERPGPTEARKHDGDPGVVLARRLSNAEYNYTIRDLTGVDMRPAREFPVDPANQAGFDNSGESLDDVAGAAEQVSAGGARRGRSHVPQRAADSRSRRIRCWWRPIATSTASSRSSTFYSRQNTDYADYFRAAWIYKHRAALGKPRATLADIAATEQGQREVSDDDLADAGDEGRRRARSRSCRRCGARCPFRRPISRSSRATAPTGCATSSSACATTRR